MGLNDVVSGERVHIGFFGVRNAGKSSIVNAVTGQELAIVSDMPGTTTDPVRKAMELLPLGPVVIVDTPGIDDTGTLGAQRVQATRRILQTIDVAVLVIDAAQDVTEADRELVRLFEQRKIPYVIACNKVDITGREAGQKISEQLSTTAPNLSVVEVSATENINIHQLKELIAAQAETTKDERHIIADLVSPNDIVVLVVPTDKAAPKGRLILPQQQTIRDLLDASALAFVTRHTELGAALASLKQPPRLVVTDSQVFNQVSDLVPEDIPLTSFSILFARYKGDLATLVRGARALDKLHDKDKVLVAEACTHHRQCNDIGTVQIPTLIRNYTGVNPDFEFYSGRGYPDDISSYKLVIHCGGCMLTRTEMLYRIRHVAAQDIPIVNYGIAIAHMQGILPRALSPLSECALLQ